MVLKPLEVVNGHTLYVQNYLTRNLKLAKQYYVSFPLSNGCIIVNKFRTLKQARRSALYD